MTEDSPGATGAVVPPPAFYLAGFVLGLIINFLSPVPFVHALWIQLLGVGVFLSAVLDVIWVILRSTPL